MRDALRAEVSGCEICGNAKRKLDIHEICRGPTRQRALDKRYAILAVCRPCHDKLGSAAEWPEARQLALLKTRRPSDFDLGAYLELTSPRAPRRIEIEDVLEWME